MRIKLVAATAPTLIKALVLTLFNILDLLSKKLGQEKQKRFVSFITSQRKVIPTFQAPNRTVQRKISKLAVLSL